MVVDDSRLCKLWSPHGATTKSATQLVCHGTSKHKFVLVITGRCILGVSESPVYSSLQFMQSTALSCCMLHIKLSVVYILILLF